MGIKFLFGIGPEKSFRCKSCTEKLAQDHNYETNKII